MFSGTSELRREVGTRGRGSALLLCITCHIVSLATISSYYACALGNIQLRRKKGPSQMELWRGVDRGTEGGVAWKSRPLRLEVPGFRVGPTDQPPPEQSQAEVPTVLLVPQAGISSRRHV